MFPRVIISATLLLLAIGGPAVADPGWLLLPGHDDLAGRAGARPSELLVYRASDGERLSSPSLSGGWPAGEPVELEEGWYFVDVGTERSTANLHRIQVVGGHVTVLPVGWISVRTMPTDRQPTAGCAQWNAEISVYVADGSGGTQRVATNRDSGVGEFGAVQLIAGTYRVVFNGLPTEIEVLAGAEVRMPLGWQDPVAGASPQLAVVDFGQPGDARISLCTDGGVHVPAGEYVAAGVTRIDEYPYERRDWVRVVIAAEDAVEPRTLDAPRFTAPQWEGEGSEAAPADPNDPVVLGIRDGGAGATPRFQGFGR